MPARDADADPAARPHRQPARHPAGRAGGEQDRSGGVRSGRVRRRSQPITTSSAPPSGSTTVTAIPLSARYGDNVVDPQPPYSLVFRPGAARHFWRRWKSRLRLLAQPFRMPVQWVSRPNSEFRGYCGTIASGRGARGRPGDDRRPRTTRPYPHHRRRGGHVPPRAGDAVTLVLGRRGRRLPRGCAGSAGGRPRHVGPVPGPRDLARSGPLAGGRTYLFKLGTALSPGSINRIRHRIDVNTGEKLTAAELVMNDVAVVNVSLQSPVALRRSQEAGRWAASSSSTGKPTRPPPPGWSISP